MRFTRTAFSVIAAVLLSAQLGYAQEIITATLANIPQRQRDAETIITPSVQRSQIPPSEGEWFRMRLTMSVSDVQDPSLTWSTMLEEFVPGTGWKFVAGGPFRGGVLINPETGQQVYPGIIFHPSQFNPAATEVRFQISIPKRMSIGAVIETFREQ
jgi:hypothetical protein